MAAASIVLLEVSFGVIPRAYSTKSNASSIQMVASANSEESADSRMIKVIVTPVVTDLDSEEIDSTIPPPGSVDVEEIDSEMKSESESVERRVLDTATEQIFSVPSLRPPVEDCVINHCATLQRKSKPLSELVTVPPQAEPTPRKSQRQEQVRKAAPQIATAELQENQGAQFDSLPTPIENPAPVYPPAALASKVEGRLVLRTSIDETGNVTKLSILRSSGNDELDQAALEAVKNWKFTPGRRLGTNVSGQIAVPVVFRISE